MTNEEKYKTVEERANAFGSFCESHSSCYSCPFERNTHCEFAWLALEAEEEKPEPCPFCGGDTMPRLLVGGFCVKCDCGYTSPFAEAETGAIAAHNRVCRAVKARKESEVAKC